MCHSALPQKMVCEYAVLSVLLYTFETWLPRAWSLGGLLHSRNKVSKALLEPGDNIGWAITGCAVLYRVVVTALWPRGLLYPAFRDLNVLQVSVHRNLLYSRHILGKPGGIREAVKLWPSLGGMKVVNISLGSNWCFPPFRLGFRRWGLALDWRSEKQILKPESVDRPLHLMSMVQSNRIRYKSAKNASRYTYFLTVAWHLVWFHSSEYTNIYIYCILQQMCKIRVLLVAWFGSSS